MGSCRIVVKDFDLIPSSFQTLRWHKAYAFQMRIECLSIRDTITRAYFMMWSEYRGLSAACFQGLFTRPSLSEPTVLEQEVGNTKSAISFLPNQ